MSHPICHRRSFIKSGLACSALGLTSGCQTVSKRVNYDTLDQALHRPVFKREFFPEPVKIASMELLHYQGNYLCRVRSTDGVEGISVSNNMQMRSLFPIHTIRVQPYFIGKDARDLDALIEGVYRTNSNYKLQSLALWVPVATAEFAILDMMGRISGKSLGELMGDIHHTKVAVYRANNYRGRSAQESIALIERNVRRDNAKALKFKVGGRMSNNADNPPGRTEALIPLVRETFGPDMTIYADSNGSYTVDEAIRIGRILEAYDVDFFEEPVPFDCYEETQAVAKALDIPIAGGEQEPSLNNFRWLIGKHALQIVQPDMFYFGGMIRSLRVARMAQALNLPCVPHISGSGLGYLYMMHFVSVLANAGPYHEFKGFNPKLPLECDTSSLKTEEGAVTVPTGPGLGVTIDPDYIQKHKVVSV